jgi:hypothetical protein
MSAYRVLRGIANVLIKILCRAEYHGRENEPKENAFIAYSNHTSFLDPVLTACAVKRTLFFMAKSDLMKSRFMRVIFKLCHIFGYDALVSLLRQSSFYHLWHTHPVCKRTYHRAVAITFMGYGTAYDDGTLGIVNALHLLDPLNVFI